MLRTHSLLSLVALSAVLATNATLAQSPAPAPSANPTQSAPTDFLTPPESVPCAVPAESGRKLFESDHAFDGFIGPITNPVLAKDPRSLTEARLLFVNNQIPPENLIGPGNFQVYGMQVRVALTDRLTFIADKDGYATLHPGAAIPSTAGWLDLAAGLKYTFIRDVEHQFLATGGFMYEIPSGEAKVFQHSGGGLFTFFGTMGKEFGCVNHFVGNFGYQQAVDEAKNSSFMYAQLHLDRQFFGWLYPLVEMNWYHYVQGGAALPATLGEGDGLLNFGTNGMAGHDLVTTALGLKAKLGRHVETGAAWEFPISAHHDIIDSRLTAELILRY